MHGIDSGKIYLNENEDFFNPERGIEYMEKGAVRRRKFICTVWVGKMYNDGVIVAK